MVRSASNIDYKTQQAEFFLRRLSETNVGFFEAQCFADAFVSANRSVTFALQAVCSSIPGFVDWYSTQQAAMRADSLMRFFHDYRTSSVHMGECPTRACSRSRGSDERPVTLYFFLPTPDLPSPPDADVVSACREYFCRTLRVVLNCYRRFSYDLDDRWHYSPAHFQSLGLTVEDAEEAMGFPRGWTAVGEATPDQILERWHLLIRHHCVGCQIGELFYEYLGETFDGPENTVSIPPQKD
jgi:hypothetical protein